jgi:hypothetical protein
MVCWCMSEESFDEVDGGEQNPFSPPRRLQKWHEESYGRFINMSSIVQVRWQANYAYFLAGIIGFLNRTKS